MPAVHPPHRHCTYAFLALLGLSGTQTGTAAEFCVRNSSQLQAALTQAASNGEDDLIRIASGTYVSPFAGNGNGFVFSSSEDRTLEISGGWSTLACSQQTADPQRTRLSGDDARRVIGFQFGSEQGNAQLRISNLSVSHGYRTAPPASGAGTMISVPEGRRGSVRIERVLYRDNHATGPDSMAGALVIFGFGQADVLMRDNLFHHNSAERASAMWLNLSSTEGTADLINNTVTANASTVAAPPYPVSAVLLNGPSFFRLYNNLVFANPVASSQIVALMHASTSHGEARYNNLESHSGNWGGAFSNNLSLTPVFAGRTDDFRLRGDSPLRNAGHPSPPVPLGEQDLAGNPRVLDDVVDIGAFESDVLFNSDFGRAL